MQHARAFVFAAEEDFGIAPVEAQACGTPVIAYGKGGALETVQAGDEATGVFFWQQTTEAIIQAVREFEAKEDTLSYLACRSQAEKFSAASFKGQFRQYCHEKWQEFAAGLPQYQMRTRDS